MKQLLTPTYMRSSYREVTPEFLQAAGVRFLLADIDNTLAPYEQAEPDEALRAWLAALTEGGIRLALVSNNDKERVERFNRSLGLPAFAKSGKPGKRSLLLAMQALDAVPSQTAMLGDQLLTDAYAGQHIGLPAIIVPPIRDKKNWFFRFKRLLERPFIRRYARRHGWQPFMTFWEIKEKA